MRPPTPTLYAQLRSAFTQPDAFQEGQDVPAEELLQAIWQHQRVHRNKLKTATGQPVFILHPGFLNREAGPDFRNALVQIGNQAPQTGDIEVDPRPADWLRHRHQTNPAYKNVVLRVVWRRTKLEQDPSELPLLELAPVLDAPPADLAEWLRQDPSRDVPPLVKGKCAAPLADLSPCQLDDLLDQAALFRLQARAEQLQARAREAGWDQALWEGIFRALGYKHNTWPMLRLAELRRRWQEPNASEREVLARLLGLGGLLPSDGEARRTASGKYTRQLWDSWWRDRHAFADCTLPSASWRLAGTRPANHPQRRLALAAAWITDADLPDRLQAWCDASQARSRLPDSLCTLLRPKPDAFWSRHYTLRSRTSAKPIPMLGIDRVSDLAANIVLPWLWARATQGRRTAVRREVEIRYLAWPSGPDNAALKLARQRLLGSPRAKLPPRLSSQHGMLQIQRDFCDSSNSLCSGCPFPKVASRFRSLRIESVVVRTPVRRVGRRDCW